MMMLSTQAHWYGNPITNLAKYYRSKLARSGKQMNVPETATGEWNKRLMMMH